MSVKLLNSSPVANLPWEDRPAGCSDVLWRYSQNPVIPRNPFPHANSTFNSAVIAHEGAYVGVFRIDDTTRKMDIFFGKSPDGLNWDISPEPIKMKCDDEEIGTVLYRYDPRLCWLEDRYWVTWCNGYHGPTIGVAYTYDFKEFVQIENAYLPFNRNGVLFPRKINGKYMMLSRPRDNGHTPFGEIYISQSPDMVHWGAHRWVMSGNGLPWASPKVGAGPIPIETSEGWLMIFHGVLTSCNGFVYSTGAALLDLEQPWKVKAVAKPYILNPREQYENVGDVPNVVFPCAAVVDGDTGRIALYYGGADTVTALAFGYVDELVEFVKANAL
jgi:beta-1,4-mannooligosaccharide/beta-1,4-mannosyl-N-acetylglucosamine phosphorylase